MIAKARVFLLELINKISDIGTVLNLYFLPRRFVTRLTNGTEVKNIHFIIQTLTYLSGLTGQIRSTSAINSGPAAAFLLEHDLRNLHGSIDGFAHVVDSQGGD